jgi:zinc transporter ZupT
VNTHSRSFIFLGYPGDVFLHTLSHISNWEEEQVGLWILGGFVVFLIADILIRAASGNHHHGHHHGKEKENTNGKKEEKCDSEEEIHISPIVLNLVGE